MNQNLAFATRLVFIKPMHRGYHGIIKSCYNWCSFDMMNCPPFHCKTKHKLSVKQPKKPANQPPSNPHKLKFHRFSTLCFVVVLPIKSSIGRFPRWFPLPSNPGLPGHCNTNGASNAALSDHLTVRVATWGGRASGELRQVDFCMFLLGAKKMNEPTLFNEWNDWGGLNGVVKTPHFPICG